MPVQTDNFKFLSLDLFDMDISGMETLSSDDSDFERSLPLGSSSLGNNSHTTMTSFSNKNNYQVSVKRQAMNQVST